MSEHLKYNTSPLEGRENFIECSTLNVVVLNTARGITHSAPYLGVCKGLLPLDVTVKRALGSAPLRSSPHAHINTVRPSKEA